jgi:hypothetical protein
MNGELPNELMNLIFSFLSRKEIICQILLLNTYIRKKLFDHIYSLNKQSSLSVNNLLPILELDQKKLKDPFNFKLFKKFEQSIEDYN